MMEALQAFQEAVQAFQEPFAEEWLDSLVVATLSSPTHRLLLEVGRQDPDPRHEERLAGFEPPTLQPQTGPRRPSVAVADSQSQVRCHVLQVTEKTASALDPALDLLVRLLACA